MWKMLKTPYSFETVCGKLSSKHFSFFVPLNRTRFNKILTSILTWCFINQLACFPRWTKRVQRVNINTGEMIGRMLESSFHAGLPLVFTNKLSWFHECFHYSFSFQHFLNELLKTEWIVMKVFPNLVNACWKPFFRSIRTGVFTAGDERCWNGFQTKKTGSED